MTVRVSKPEFNLREKISELDKPTGVKGSELMRSDTAQDTRDLISAGRKNLIINGNMQIAQRGTSFDSDTVATYTLDRFQLANSGGITFEATVTQDSSAPDGFRKSLKISPDTVETSMSDSENAMIQQSIEGLNCQDFAFGTPSAKKLTISFYAKSGSQNNNHQYTLQIRKYDDSGNRNMVNRAFTVTTSWKRYTMTFDGDTAENIRNDHTTGMQIIWHLATGPSDIHGASTTFGRTVNTSLYSGVTGQSNFLDNTSNEFYLTGCQLEVGGNATEFEHRPYTEELTLCERFYEVHWQNHNPNNPAGAHGDGYNAISAGGVAGTKVYFPFKYRTQKRAIPTLEYSGKFRISGGSGGNSSNVTPDEFYSPSIDGGRLRFPQSGGSNGDGMWLEFDGANSTNGYIAIAAEV